MPADAAVAIAWPAAVAAAPRPLPSLVVAQVPAAALGGRRSTAGRFARPSAKAAGSVLVGTGGRTRVLTAGFDSAADPEVSFDGRRVLFAGRKAKGGSLVRVGDERGRLRGPQDHVRRRRYPPARLPVDDLHDHATGVEPWVQIAFVGVNPGERERGGGRAEHEPVVVQDRRHCAAAADLQPVERHGPRHPARRPDDLRGLAAPLGAARADGRVALLGVNDDGTDYQTYAGDQGLRVKQMPMPTVNGLVVFVESDRIAGGRVGAPRVGEPGRPLHTYRR